MTQIDAGGGWVINNASGEWFAVNRKTGQTLGPFKSWMEARRAIDESR